MLTTVFEIRKKIIEGYGKYEYIVAPAFGKYRDTNPQIKRRSVEKCEGHL